MPKTKQTTAADPVIPEESLNEAAAAISEVTEVRWRYVGPEYTLGIQLHGRRDLLRPLDMSPDQVATLIEQHPKCAAWWLPEEKL